MYGVLLRYQLPYAVFKDRVYTPVLKTYTHVIQTIKCNHLLNFLLNMVIIFQVVIIDSV